MELLEKYINEFIAQDDEIYKNLIPNEKALEWLKNEIPLFECSDKDIEKTYYYRWFTYRKHLKKTPDGYIISEFLPDVCWSGKYNSIVAAAGFHASEGKWLKNADKYLPDYINLFLDGKGDAYAYSNPLVHAVNELSDFGVIKVSKELFDKCEAFFANFEKEHKTECGLYWSYDGRDAMEFSISGTRDMQRTKGVRPTLNSYMFANAEALARMAKALGYSEKKKQYEEKAMFIKEKMLKMLFRNGFFYAIHPENEDFSESSVMNTKETAKELIGYIPWIYGIAPEGYESAFDELFENGIFYSEYGALTADRTHERFLFECTHECLWNGYVWPFAITQTLDAIKSLIDVYGAGEKYKKLYSDLLSRYAKMQYRITGDGKKIMWIDEVRHPLRDEWSSREILKNFGWREDKGGYERGKDYNHSKFCDHVLSYLTGIDVRDGKITFSPEIPDGIDYYRIDGLCVKGRVFSVAYDRDGTRYKNGQGVSVFEQKDGKMHKTDCAISTL